ncbi:hypothetical protein Btru_011793 [Bulinus truncatus]|nr:hypothetical protein Btru_011793 [Bulinus truncatus]
MPYEILKIGSRPWSSTRKNSKVFDGCLHLRSRVAAAQLNLVVKRMNNLPDRNRLLNSLASILHENNSQQRSRESRSQTRQSTSGRRYGRAPDNFLDISVVPTLSDLLDGLTSKGVGISIGKTQSLDEWVFGLLIKG